MSGVAHRENQLRLARTAVDNPPCHLFGDDSPNAVISPVVPTVATQPGQAEQTKEDQRDRHISQTRTASYTRQLLYSERRNEDQRWQRTSIQPALVKPPLHQQQETANGKTTSGALQANLASEAPSHELGASLARFSIMSHQPARKQLGELEPQMARERERHRRLDGQDHEGGEDVNKMDLEMGSSTEDDVTENDLSSLASAATLEFVPAHMLTEHALQVPSRSLITSSFPFPSLLFCVSLSALLRKTSDGRHRAATHDQGAAKGFCRGPKARVQQTRGHSKLGRRHRKQDGQTCGEVEFEFSHAWRTTSSCPFPHGSKAATPRSTKKVTKTRHRIMIVWCKMGQRLQMPRRKAHV